MNTPINALPLELFSKIVFNAIESDGTHGQGMNTRGTLRLVTRCWKAVLDSNPLFWTTIVIDKSAARRDDHTLPQRPSLNIFPAVSFALRHALSLPLDLTIILPDAASRHFHAGHANKLGYLLITSASRIRSLNISGLDWTLHLALLYPFCNIPMRSLERFTHTVCEKPELSASESFEDFIQLPEKPSPILQFGYLYDGPASVNLWGSVTYPSLKYVEITGAPYDWPRFPTAGLKTLRLSLQPLENTITTVDFRQMLSFAAPTLEELEVSNVLEITPGNVNPVVLPALHTLRVAYEIPDDIAFALPHIRAPALKHLSLRDDLESEDTVTDISALLSAMMEFLPLGQVESLSLTQIKFSAVPESPIHEDNLPIVLRFLRSLKQVKYLELSMPPNNPIWSYLNFPCTKPDELPQYPNLYTLEAMSVAGDSDEVMGFLMARRQPKPLHVVVGDFVAYHMSVERFLEMEDRIRQLAWQEPLPLDAWELRMQKAKRVLEEMKQTWDAMVQAAMEVDDGDDEDRMTVD